MKTHPLRPFVLFLLLGVLLFPFTVKGEQTLSEFTSTCESELQIPQNSITGFDCRNGELLPTEQFGKKCDSQALLDGVGCLDGSRLGAMTFSNPDVVGVWVCRKYTTFHDKPENDKYHDIAMIINNRKNGKTCFFQNNLPELPNPSEGPVVPGPKANSPPVWLSPAETSRVELGFGKVCTSCHNNDPFIVTPHVAEALKFHGLLRFNPRGPYSVVQSEPGQDFARFKGEIFRVEGCGGLCHYDPPPLLRTDAKNKNWMPPGHPNAPHWKTPAFLGNPELDTPEGYSPYNFNPSPGQFYTLRANGEIRGFNGAGFIGSEGGSCNNIDCPHWTVLGNRTDTAEIAASGTKLYSRETTGFIREFTDVQCTQINSSGCPDWLLLDNNPNTAQIVSGDGKLYQMWHDGTIWQYTGTPCKDNNCPGWQQLDHNANTVEIVASGNNLYQRHKSGAVWEFTGKPCSGNSCPGWQMIANDARTIQLVIGNRVSLYMFQQAGAIWKYTGTPCNSTGCPGWRLVDFDNTNTKQVAAGSDNLYRLHKDGAIWRYKGTDQNWEQLDNHTFTTEISASVNGLLQLHTQGDVYKYNGPVCSNGSCPGWIKIQNNRNTTDIVGARQ